MSNKDQKPERYVVLHQYSMYGQTEEAWASYSTKLDGKFPWSAANLAIQTAKRYFGDLFLDYGDGQLVFAQSYRKSQ